MLIGVRTELPDVIIHLDQAAIPPAKVRREKEDKSVTDTIKAEYYKEMEHQDNKMDRHKELETVDDIKLDADGRDDITIDAEYGDLCQDILDTSAEFPPMWDGRLVRIDVAKHCI